jgi:hypothetical protein
MKNSFLFFIFFTLTAQISFAKSYNLSSCFKSEKCLNLEAEDSVGSGYIGTSSIRNNNFMRTSS